MNLLFDSFLLNILAALTTTFAIIYTFFKWKFSYWERRNLPYLKPTFPFGNTPNAFLSKKSAGFAVKDAYDELKTQGYKHGGIFNFDSPVYLPVDLEYVKNVMQNDFRHFVDRGLYYNEKEDPLSAHLFAIGGQKWRHMRTKLTPAFTSGKMKMMFETLMACSKPLEEAVGKTAENKKPVDIKEMVARFTTDIIGSCAFGLECNSFKDEEPEFRKCGKQMFKFGRFRLMGVLMLLSKPEIGKLLGIKLLPKNMTDFFMGVIKDAVKYRETNHVVRKDMLQLMLQLKNDINGSGKPLTVEEIAAQAFVFFIAGFETSSTTMTFCLYELSQNQEIQQRVRNEINEVLRKYDNNITYEALMDMKYMGQVIDETLRKYPPVPFITRRCVVDYRVPGTDVTIEKGSGVFISTLGLHRDPEYYPDPEMFDPERFSDENKKQIHPFSFIPFGEGPRICIGLRFGIMQTKAGLATLLKNYKFSLNQKTKVPLTPDPHNVLFSTTDAVLLDAEKI